MHINLQKNSDSIPTLVRGLTSEFEDWQKSKCPAALWVGPIWWSPFSRSCKWWKTAMNWDSLLSPPLSCFYLLSFPFSPKERYCLSKNSMGQLTKNQWTLLKTNPIRIVQCVSLHTLTIINTSWLTPSLRPLQRPFSKVSSWALFFSLFFLSSVWRRTRAAAKSDCMKDWKTWSMEAVLSALFSSHMSSWTRGCL